MKTSILISKIGVSLISVLSLSTTYSQCPVTAVANPQTIVCGDLVTLGAFGTPGTYIFNNTFNAGNVGTGWSSTSAAQYNNPCGPGPGGATNAHLWMGSTSPAPRNATTNAFDLTLGGTVCFDMRYAIQGDCPAVGTCDCEGPDLPDEGVHLQYSTNGGTTWVDINYWSPNGGSDPTMTSWNTYCMSIPAAAMTASTMIRWVQTTSSSNVNDHWGLDNVSIAINSPNFVYDWAHDALAPATTPNTPPVMPTSTTTYTVTYTDITNPAITCQASVTVNVLSPTVTATVNPSFICPGAPVRLRANSSLSAAPPAACGPSPVACDPLSTIASERQLGSGALLSQASNPGMGYLGASNFDGAVHSQFVIRASDLVASGFQAGKFTSIQFDVASNSAGSKLMNDFRITMMCTSATQLAGTALFNVSAGTVVHSPKNVNITTGWQTLFFDQGYNWDGVTNLIVDMCWRTNAGANANIITRHYSTLYPATNTDGTNTSGAQTTYNCASATGAFGPYNSLPNFKFGQCVARPVTLTYSWTSNPAGFTSSVFNPTATPTTSTTYTVSVLQSGSPAGCAVTASVPVTVIRPIVSVNPNPATYCAGSPAINLAATASTQGGVRGNFTFTSDPNPNAAIPGTATPLNNVNAVSGVFPDNLASSPIVNVTVNITHPLDNELAISLVSPSGGVINLSDGNGGLAGANYTNTVFTQIATHPLINTGAAPFTGNFRPEQALSGLTGVVNGNWILRVSDNQTLVNAGTLNSWSITFLGDNGITTYSWTPPGGLSSTTTPNTTANPPNNAAGFTTYTLTVTDAFGCQTAIPVVVNTNCALPVEVKNFDADCMDDDRIALSWSSESEINSDYYQVEKSKDGFNYTILDVIQATGNSVAEKTYQVIDEEINRSTPNTYYRLAEYDLDGTRNELFNLSANNCFSSERSACIAIYPNVVQNNQLNVSTVGMKNEALNFDVVDLTGKLIQHYSIQITGDQSNERVDLPNGIASGVYIVRSLNEIEFCTQKIIVE